MWTLNKIFLNIFKQSRCFENLGRWCLSKKRARWFPFRWQNINFWKVNESLRENRKKKLRKHSFSISLRNCFCGIKDNRKHIMGAKSSRTEIYEQYLSYDIYPTEVIHRTQLVDNSLKSLSTLKSHIVNNQQENNHNIQLFFSVS